ncbi:uncharacterized protein LOC144118713 [Amblyomma americanum]
MDADRAPLLAEVEPCDGESRSTPPTTAGVSASKESSHGPAERGMSDVGRSYDRPGGSGDDDASQAANMSQRGPVLEEGRGVGASPPRQAPRRRRGNALHRYLSRCSPTLLLITLLNLTVLLLLLLYWRQKIVDFLTDVRAEG